LSAEVVFEMVLIEASRDGRPGLATLVMRAAMNGLLRGVVAVGVAIAILLALAVPVR
jgi:hypothetical protein